MTKITTNTPIINKNPTTSKSQNTAKKPNLQVKLPPNLLNNEKTNNEPMVLQTTNNFITSISNTLKNKLLDVDINATFLQHIADTIYTNCVCEIIIIVIKNQLFLINLLRSLRKIGHILLHLLYCCICLFEY